MTSHRPRVVECAAELAKLIAERKANAPQIDQGPFPNVFFCSPDCWGALHEHPTCVSGKERPDTEPDCDTRWRKWTCPRCPTRIVLVHRPKPGGMPRTASLTFEMDRLCRAHKEGCAPL